MGRAVRSRKPLKQSSRSRLWGTQHPYWHITIGSSFYRVAQGLRYHKSCVGGASHTQCWSCTMQGEAQSTVTGRPCSRGVLLSTMLHQAFVLYLQPAHRGLARPHVGMPPCACVTHM